MQLFAGLAEAVGARELDVGGEPAPATVAQLAERLRREHPPLAAGRWRVAVNHRYARDEDTLSAHDEIALIPPVSGG